jgi:hypothetical protein
MKIAKNKADKTRQRMIFEKFDGETEKEARTFMQQHVKLKDICQFIDENGKIQWTDDRTFDLNTLARILHISVDPEAVQILNVIFAGAPADAKDERAVLDDKSTRAAALWQRIADEFVNNAAWKPQNIFGEVEPAVTDIDPSKTPVRNIRGEELRGQLKELRGKSYCSRKMVVGESIKLLG